jgi:hypothetical protein
MWRVMIKTYLRNFIPLTKSAFRIAFQKNSTPNLEVVEKKQEQKKGQSFAICSITPSNVLFIFVDDLIIPVFNDQLPITLSIPLKRENQTIEFQGIGFFKKTGYHRLKLRKIDTIRIQSLPFDRGGAFQVGIKAMHNVNLPDFSIELRDAHWNIQNTEVKEVNLNNSNEQPQVKTPQIQLLDELLEEKELNLQLNRLL